MAALTMYARTHTVEYLLAMSAVKLPSRWVLSILHYLHTGLVGGGGGGDGEVATPEPPRSAPDDIILPASMSHKTIQKGIKEIRNLVRNLEIIKTGKITR